MHALRKKSQIRSSSSDLDDYQRTTQLPRIQHYLREGMRQIAQEFGKDSDASQDEQYRSIIQKSNALFSNDEDYINQTFQTDPKIWVITPDNEVNAKFSGMKVYKSTTGRNTDPVSLQMVYEHYNSSFNKAILLKGLNNRNMKIPRISIKNKRYHKLNEAYEKQSRIKQNLEEIKRPNQNQVVNQEDRIFSQTVNLIFVDLLQPDQSPSKATLPISLEQYFLCTLRKNLQVFLDKEIESVVVPLIDSMKEKQSLNQPINEGLKNRFDSIKTKQEFLSFMSIIQGQRLQDSLDDMIKHFFIPNITYRQQLVQDLIEHINHTLKIKEIFQTPKVKFLCTVRGEPIIDFIQIPWDVKVLFGYSSQKIILQKLPIIEKLLLNLQKKLKINFDDQPIEQKSQKLSLTNSLKRAVSLMKQEPEKMKQDYNHIAPINQFLQRLSVKQSNEKTHTNQSQGKVVTLMDQVISVVRNAKQTGNDLSQILLTPLEIQMIHQEYPGWTDDEITKIRKNFRSLVFQNEYFQVKQGMTQVNKTYMSDKTYLGPILDSLRKLPSDTFYKIFTAAEIQMDINEITTIVDWPTYLKIQALFEARVNFQFLQLFLKNYFDPNNTRWLKTNEVDDLLESIPPPEFPNSFRFLFIQLVKSWFKDMGFFRDNDDFDCTSFQNPINNTVVLRYILQWIVGYYDQLQYQQQNQ